MRRLRVRTAWFFVLWLTLISILVTWHSVSDYRNAATLDQVKQVSQNNTDLICVIDRLFKLDKPIPSKQFNQLTVAQKTALLSLIAECPNLRSPKHGNT